MAIRENIIDNIVTTLGTITVANGYNNDIVTVTREPNDWTTLNPGKCPAAMVLWSYDERERGETPMSGQHLLSELHVVMRGVVYAKSGIEEALNAFEEDIEKAMCVDDSRGGYAEYTIPARTTVFASTDAYYIEFEFEFVIVYQYIYGSP